MVSEIRRKDFGDAPATVGFPSTTSSARNSALSTAAAEYTNRVKHVGSEVTPLERAVAPFPTVYLSRLGLALMSKDGSQVDTASAVRTWIESGGNLEVDLLCQIASHTPATEHDEGQLCYTETRIEAVPIGSAAKATEIRKGQRQSSSLRVPTLLAPTPCAHPWSRPVTTTAWSGGTCARPTPNVTKVSQFGIESRLPPIG